MLAYRPSTRACSTRQTGQPLSQCRSHDAGATTQLMNEAYGAQLRRSTFPAAARQKPLTRCTSNGRLHLAFWRIRARRQSLVPGFEMGTQMFKVFSCSAQTYHLPALTASVRTTSRNASWSRKLSSAIVQTTSRTIMKVRRSTLKILNMKTRKATTNIRSAMTRRRHTHITTKHCETMPPCSTVHQLRSLPRMQQLPQSLSRM